MKMTLREARKLGLGKLFQQTHVPDAAEKKARLRAATAEQQGRNGLLFDKLCEKHGLPIPVHEYKFHPKRRWKLDFLFDGLVALEVEGGLFGIGPKCPTCKQRKAGGHKSVERLKSDMEKYNEAHILGYVVLRCLPESVEDGSVFGVIRRALAAREEQS
jgi:hypothetical protein